MHRVEGTLSVKGMFRGEVVHCRGRPRVIDLPWKHLNAGCSQGRSERRVMRGEGRSGEVFIVRMPSKSQYVTLKLTKFIPTSTVEMRSAHLP